MPFVVEINTRESDNFSNPIQVVDFFSSIKLSLKYDSLFSSFQLEYLFDPSKEKDLEIAGITHYHEAIISYRSASGNLKRILTGFVLSQNFVDAPTPQLLSIGGYSKPGVLDDCDILLGNSNETSNVSTKSVVEAVCRSYFIEAIIGTPLADQANSDLRKVVNKPVENAGSFLKTICCQKNIVLTHDEFGRVVIKKAETEKAPILEFDADQNPRIGYEKMNLNFNGQALYSTIEVTAQADDESENQSSAILTNPFVPISGAIIRFKCFEQKIGDRVDVEEAANNELSKNLKNIVLTIDIVTETAKTELVLPENTVIVKNSRLNMFDKVKWFIESVDIEQDSERTRQTITCVLPWVYNLNARSADGKISGPYNVFIKSGKNRPGE